MRRCLRLFGTRVIGAMIAAVALVCVTLPAPARASDCDAPLNGIYTASSDGVWAKTNDSYHDEVSVKATWTVATECSTFISCTGTVRSDQGWSAPAVCTSGTWIVTRDVPNWETCADGSAVTGRQKFNFSSSQSDPTNFDGEDKTIGPSGACGVNRWLTVAMPFTLTKL
jgi:hypothetical protein